MWRGAKGRAEREGFVRAECEDGVKEGRRVKRVKREGVDV